MRETHTPARRVAGPAFWLLLALVLTGLSGHGCSGDDAASTGTTTTTPQTGTVIVRQNLLRAVPSNVTAFRFIGFDSNGNLAFGPQVVSKASEVTLTVPVSVVDFHIEYLVGNTIIGIFQTNLSLTPGATVVIEDPAWVDVGGTAVGPAAQLAFIVQPSNGAPGQTLGPTAIAIQDASGNLVTTAANPITLALGTNTTGATLGGTLTLNPVNGVASFQDLSVNLAGTYDLTATADGLTSATSQPFTVTDQPIATTLNFVTQPPNGQVGQPLTPAVDVEVLDQFGARLTTFTGNLSALLGNNPVGASLTGGDATAASGLASFDALVLNKAGVGFTLVVNGAGLAPIVSMPFAITVAQLPIDLFQVSLVCPAQITPGASSSALFCVATADFNNDGRTDLAMADTTNNNVRVLLRQADGTFSSLDLTVTGVTAILTGDVNNDANADLITLNPSANTKSVVLGNGDGTFQAAVNSVIPANSSSFALGELTGDSLPDLVVGSRSTVANRARINVYHNAAGAYPDVPTATFDTNTGSGNPSFTGVVIANVDGNALPDVVGVVSGTNATVRGLYPYLNYNSGTMTFATTPVVATPGLTVALQNLVVGDFDGDTDLDVAGVNGTGAFVRALTNDGTGTFTEANGSPFALSSTPLNSLCNVVVGNFDADAASELAVICRSTSANGQNSINVLDQSATSPTPLFGTAIQSQAPFNAVSLAIGEFGGDARPDLAVASNSGTNLSAQASVILGLADNRFGPPHLGDTDMDATPDFTTTSIRIADMNGDGLLDLVAGTGDGRIAIWLATAAGTYASNPSLFVLGNESGGNAFSSVSDIAVANFDGATGNDLAVLCTDTVTFNRFVRFFVSNGANPPVFSEPAGSAIATSGGSQLSLADLNGDANPDLVANRTGPNGLLAMTNSGAFPFTATDVPAAFSGSFAVGNFDGQTGDDVVMQGLFQIQVVRNMAGTLTPGAIVSSPGGQNMASIGLGDVTGDGFLDVVAGSISTAAPGQIFVFNGNGAGSFTAGSSTTDLSLLATATNAQTLTVADANGDGLQDVIVANRENSDLSVLLGRGNGSFDTGCALLAGYATGLATGDLDGNGRLDFVTSNGGPVQHGGVTPVFQR